MSREMWSWTDSALVSNLSDDGCLEASAKEVLGPDAEMELFAAEAEVVATAGSGGLLSDRSRLLGSESFATGKEVEGAPSSELLLLWEVSLDV